MTFGGAFGFSKRLTLLSLVPLLGVIYFAISGLSGKSQLLEEAEQTMKFAELAQLVSSLTHELQRERGMSSGFLGSEGDRFIVKLRDQRIATDRELGSLQRFLGSLDRKSYGAPVAHNIDLALQELSHLSRTRRDVDRLGIGVKESVDYYSGAIQSFFRAIIAYSRVSNNAEYMTILEAYINALQIKENAGLERAILSNTLGRGDFAPGMYPRFVELSAKQELYTELFKRFATEQQIAVYNDILKDIDLAEIERIRMIGYFAEVKTDLITRMTKHIGYGGMTHHNMEYILRGDRKDLDAFYNHYREFLLIVNEYLELPSLLDSDRQDMLQIRNTFDSYAEYFGAVIQPVTRAETLEQNKGLVRVDNDPAIMAFNRLLKGRTLGVDPEDWFNKATQRIERLRQIEDRLSQDMAVATQLMKREAHSQRLWDLVIGMLICFIVAGITFYGLILATKFRQKEDALEHSYQKLCQADAHTQGIINQAVDGIITTDKYGFILAFNPAAETMFQFSAAEVIGSKISIFIPEFLTRLNVSDSGSDLGSAVDETISKTPEMLARRKDWSTFSVELGVSEGVVINGKLQYTALVRDISERKKVEGELYQLANFDTLTGLPNRSQFKATLNTRLEEANRKKTKLALLFLDLDRFKVINDSLGHTIGDELLIQAADRLQLYTRQEDRVFRIGGDEFTIVLENFRDPRDLLSTINRILHEISQPFDLSGHEVVTTTSIGVSIYPEDGRNIHELLKNADTAMYKAKKEGRNNYQFFTEEMKIEAVNRLTVESKLRQALDKSEFTLHYQPKINSNSGGITGFEALIRWQHPEDGLVPPGEFIPIAEDTGMILPIGEWVLREACRQHMVWKRAGVSSGKIAVNLAAQQFHYPDIVNVVTNILNQEGMGPEDLELEITESTLMKDMDHTVKTQGALRALGVSLSLDDFGTGYSSLSYLKRFPVQTLKIDRSFVSNVIHNKQDASIVDAIINLAKSLNLKLVAEGVETKEQYEYMKARGCEDIQGYLFSPPLPASQATHFIQMMNSPVVSADSLQLEGGLVS